MRIGPGSDRYPSETITVSISFLDGEEFLFLGGYTLSDRYGP